MSKKVIYKLRSGKPIKILDLSKNFLGLLKPDVYYRVRLNKKLKKVQRRSDYEYIKERVNYYIKINHPWTLDSKDEIQRSKSWLLYRGAIGNYRRKMFCTAYFFDQHDVTRWFPSFLRWNFCPGDVYFTPHEPTVVKSRLLSDTNQNSVLLKLDKLRHFLFVQDRKAFTQKMDKVIFRGKIRDSRLRTSFIEKFIDNPLCDCGVVGKNQGYPKEWMVEKKTIRQHLDYKFIMAIEGNDVASNLKWVMSSNSIAVMPHPTCETWFMEGKLIPDYHYIEVKDDFSDLEEKVTYYASLPNKAEEIIHHAHEFVHQFMDTKRENLIQLLVLGRYFKTSGQLETYLEVPSVK